jgi:hypothetical protein
MNAMIERLTHRPGPTLRQALKGAFACAMFAVILLGALYFLIDKEYTPGLQFGAAGIGAILGAIIAWAVSAQSSKN